MKNMFKRLSSVLSLVLVVLLLLEMLPMATLAATFQNQAAEEAYLSSLVADPAEVQKNTVAALCEETSKRDEFTKVYKKEDGTYTALFSSTPLHYLNEGKWEEIDNTLVAKNGTLTNTAGEFSVSLPETMTNDSTIHLQKDGTEISFAYEGVSGRKDAVVSKEATPADTGIANADKAIAKTRAEVTYNGVAADTDLQYTVLPGGLKENIIIADEDSVQAVYTFTLTFDQLNYTVNKDGSIEFKDAKGSTKFVVPQPVMYDAKLSLSYDIGVSVKDNKNGTMSLSYAPSEKWTHEKNRVYPITIDPAIMLEGEDGTWVEDTLVTYNSQDSTVATRNHYDSGLGIITNAVDNGTTLISEVYTRINTNLLRSLGDNIVITDATYMLTANYNAGRFEAREITSACDFETVTYNTRPTVSSSVIDYFASPYGYDEQSEELEYIHFNIIEPLNRWMSGNNNGFAIIAQNTIAQNTIALVFLNGLIGGDTYSTTMLVDYADVSGHNGHYNYHSQEIGRAGTGYVNDFTGGLCMSRQDLSLEGKRAPVSISMNYKPAILQYIHVLLMGENEELPAPFNQGWWSNYNRFLFGNEHEVLYFSEEGGMVEFYVGTDEDDALTFTEKDGFASGYTLTAAGDFPSNGTSSDVQYLQISRPDGGVERFNSAGFLVSVAYADNDPATDDDTIAIDYLDDSFMIDSVTDGVGREYKFIYDVNTAALSSIACFAPDGITPVPAGSTAIPLGVTYSYTNGLLTSVTYADGKSVQYEYDLNERLVKATNVDGYRICYSYGSDGRVSSVLEQARNSSNNYVNGNSVTYTRLGAKQVQLTDGVGVTEIYQFNTAGELLYTTDNAGNFLKNEDASGSTNDSVFITTSGFAPLSQNLLINPSFETERSSLITDKGKYWTGGSSFTRVSSESAHNGNYVYTATANSAVTTYAGQEVASSCSGIYTLSAYVKKANETDGTLTLRVSGIDSSNNVTANSLTIDAATSEWQRYSVSVNASNPATVKAEFGFNNAVGAFLVDDVQLERSASDSAFNLLENGSFTNGTDGWTNSGIFTIASATIFDDTVSALQLPGGVGNTDTAYKTVPINGTQGDTFTVSGWFQGNFIPSAPTSTVMEKLVNSQSSMFNYTYDRYAQIEVSYQYTETDENNNVQTLTDTIAVPFAYALTDWQLASQTFALKGDTDEITVLVRYAKNANAAQVAEFSLTREENAISLNIEDEPATLPEEEETDTCQCSHCEDPYCTCTCENEENCQCKSCSRFHNTETITLSQNNEYISSVATSSFDGDATFSEILAFSSDGNYPTTQIDANNAVTTFAYNPLNGVLSSVTTPDNSVVSYVYNALSYLSNASSQNGSLTSSVSYVYTDDKVTSVTANGSTYIYAYDLWGQLTSVSVGTQMLVSYSYGTGSNRSRLSSVVYYNGDEAADYPNTTVSYYYENQNLDYITVNGETKYDFIYGSTGELLEISATDSRTISYRDGRTEIRTLDAAPVTIYVATTDEDGNPVENYYDDAIALSVSPESYEDTYISTNGGTAAKSDVVATGTLNNTVTTKTIGTVTSSDWFGRTTSSIVKTESAADDDSTNNFAAVSTDYTYYTYTNNNKTYTSDRVTAMVNQATYGSTTEPDSNDYQYASQYTYDAADRITSESITTPRYSVNISYAYDSFGQLVRVNDSGRGTSTTYSYDAAGNILAKTQYPYTTGDLGTATRTTAYAYGNSVWPDLLTQYNGSTITYDDIGNPLVIGNKTFTWQGRELQSCNVSNINYTNNISYSYDENGLRHSKIVKRNNTVYERYDYVWSDDRLVAQSYTRPSVGSTSTARFVYGNDGELQGFLLRLNENAGGYTAAYLYVRNLQGDIVAIVDEGGNAVVEYTYDAWGAISASTPSGQDPDLTAILTRVSPFTYRGYCYDYDTALYYLQSRYYDPAIGRFINADSTEYLGATGTLLSFNLFAYCENDFVNQKDVLGTWGEDVHRGYYTHSKNSNKVKTHKFTKISDSKYLFGSEWILHIPYIINKQGITENYGTYYWAISIGIKADYSRVIADSCNEIDSLCPPIYANYQSWHFNTNTNDVSDSRKILSFAMCLEAKYNFDQALRNRRNSKKYQQFVQKGLIYLGYALHPMQDLYAHTKDKCYRSPVPYIYEWTDEFGRQQQRTTTVIGWSHLRVADTTDNARVRQSQLKLTEKQTKQILTAFMNNYKTIFKQ